MASSILGLLIASPSGASFEGFSLSPGSGASAPAAGDASAGSTVRVYLLEDGESVAVDGKLDDPVWQKVETASSFRVWDPDRGSVPSEQTAFKVAHDTDAIYFAVACGEHDPQKISKKLSRRDRFSNSDLVSIYIDPYHDRTTGYNFRVNPLGVQQDSYIYNDGERDDDWDAVWEAEAYEDQDGWYAEFRIPFSSIRYRREESTWGLQVYRYMHGRGEDTAWVTWDRELSGFVSRFGQLEGFRDVPAPRQLEVLPYAVSRFTDSSTPGPDKMDGFQNFGADLKYGVTADLSLNATIQPDFGQVEADPAVLNLSPFETFFEEKRPFFIEGSRFFQHPDFNLFYSRRIGTGDRNSRIRYAGKLTGKTVGGFSVAALAASTDITQEGQTHNLFKNGSQLSRYFVGRFGKEFNRGTQRFNLTQTAVVNTGSRDEYGDRGSREAYTSGVDWNLQFRDRAYTLAGSFVGSIIDPEPLRSDPTFKPIRSYGTGGELDFTRSAGNLHGGAFGRWESDRLDLNDMGFLSSPDEMVAGGWLSHRYNPDGKSPLFNRGELNFNFDRSWLYGARTGFDLHTASPAWSYQRGHRQFLSTNINGWCQFRNFGEAWFGILYNGKGTQRYETRDRVTLLNGDEAAIPGGGPLIDEPVTYGGWAGANTDARKDLVLEVNAEYYRDTALNHSTDVGTDLRWNQSSAVSHELALSFNNRVDDTQHLENFETPGGGIGGVSYVFAKIHQRTLDATLRTNLLFSRNQSLELYAQPFLTVGDYRTPRYLTRADSYDLDPYHAPAFNADDYEFSFASVNWNSVYRWEYRPGSTLFLVWTHSRSTYEERGFFENPSSFDNGLRGKPLFKNEPENVFLIKVSYWLPI